MGVAARRPGASAERGLTPDPPHVGWIVEAKRPETRAARVGETARLAEQNVRPNRWSRR